MALKIYTEPSSEPVTLADAKSHCKIFITDDDDLINSYITAARKWVEHTGIRRALITQTLELYLDAFPDWEINPPRPPLKTIVSIKYYDTNGVLQTLSSALYTLDIINEPGRITPAYGQCWPSTRDIMNAVIIQYTAGYGEAAAVPKDIWHAILFLVAHAYENRQPVGDIGKQIPFSVNALLAPYKIFGGTTE